MFKHILISTDGSTVSMKAAKAGIALAKALGAKITAYSAMEPPQPLYMQGYAFTQYEVDTFDEGARQAAQKRVDAIGKLSKTAGVPCTSVVDMAATAYEGIIGAAKKRRCDAIFMASHGRRGFSKLIMGSVTQKVLSHTRIPVVVFR